MHRRGRELPAPQVRGALRTSQAVANASGGFFRLGNRVSASEQKALDRIEAAFETE